MKTPFDIELKSRNDSMCIWRDHYCNDHLAYSNDQTNRSPFICLSLLQNLWKKSQDVKKLQKTHRAFFYSAIKITTVNYYIHYIVENFENSCDSLNKIEKEWMHREAYIQITLNSIHTYLHLVKIFKYKIIIEQTPFITVSLICVWYHRNI